MHLKTHPNIFRIFFFPFAPLIPNPILALLFPLGKSKDKPLGQTFFQIKIT
jgi:hypothetical protein